MSSDKPEPVFKQLHDHDRSVVVKCCHLGFLWDGDDAFEGGKDFEQLQLYVEDL